MKLKMPWTKRAEREEQLRRNAESRLREISKDWEPLRQHKARIDREIELNDWTATAVTLFAGDKRE